MNDLAITGAGLPSIHEMYQNKAAFENIQRVAKMFSASDLVPARYKDNIQNTVIALELAQRMRASSLMVMQSLYVVHGQPGWSGQFVIASVNACGKYAEDLDFEFTGTEGKDDWACRAITTDKKGRTRRGAKVDIKMAKSEGWYDKNGSKWKTMPEQMLMYRAASFFARVHCPEVLNGMYTVEEINDYTVLADVQTQAYIEKLIRSSSLDPEEQEELMKKLDGTLPNDEAEMIIHNLQLNQLNPITHTPPGGSFSQTDIKNHIQDQNK